MDSPPGVEHQVDGVVVPRTRDHVQLRGLDHRSLRVIVGVISRPRMNIRCQSQTLQRSETIAAATHFVSGKCTSIVR